MLTSEQLDTIATRATQSDMLAMRSADLLSLVAMARAYLDQCERGSVSLALERLGEVAAERDAARAECEELAALAYIGGERFPDLAYKSRLDECAHDLRKAESERDAARAKSATSARHLAASQSALSKAMGELTEARGELERCREKLAAALDRQRVFHCPGCDSNVPWEEGASDDYGDLCDRCANDACETGMAQEEYIKARSAGRASPTALGGSK